jgi:hypothetical protein
VYAAMGKYKNMGRGDKEKKRNVRRNLTSLTGLMNGTPIQSASYVVGDLTRADCQLAP